MQEVKCDNVDLIMAISLFQKLHPYTEILSITKEKWDDFSKDNTFDVFVFQTAKTTVRLSTYQILQDMMKK